MLNRHGTRLDVGTPEDVAELDAVEAVQRQGNGMRFGASTVMQERESGHYEHHHQQQPSPASTGMHVTRGGRSATAPRGGSGSTPPPYY